MSASRSLSVVIPVYNEAATIAALLERVLAAPLPPEIGHAEIVAVDDCSKDDTLKALETFKVPEPARDRWSFEVRRHEVNRGKGAALRTGFADPNRCVLGGASWGGYLTLLGLGVQPGRWAVGIGIVPIGDYVAAFEDEMEPLKRYDAALFGGTPKEAAAGTAIAGRP